MGFSRYLLYVRQTDVIDLAEQRPVQYWTRKGVLVLVLWNVRGGVLV